MTDRGALTANGKSGTAIGDTQVANPAAGEVMGCLMPKSTGPVAGDFSSLKEAAEHRIKKGDITGLNPHKVKRLCIEFEELRGRDAFSQAIRQRCINSLRWMVADMKHRFDDCRNNFEVTAIGDGGAETAAMATGGYSDELNEAINLLAELEAGTEEPDEDREKKIFREGFDHAKTIILAEIAKIANR